MILTSCHVRDDIPVSVRLRRAIIRNDTLLVKRIVKSNPLYLHNPDFNDKCNTSLHLAATFGHVEIVVRTLLHIQRG